MKQVKYFLADKNTCVILCEFLNKVYYYLYNNSNDDDDDNDNKNANNNDNKENNKIYLFLIKRTYN